MLNNAIISSNEKLNVISNTTHKIHLYYEMLSTLEKFYDNLGCSVHIACYANFRDALFHYKKIYESSDLLGINGNLYALDEHLHRSVKDALVFLLNYLVDWVEPYCIKHDLDCNIVEYIENKHSDILKPFNWTHSKLLKISHDIENDFSVSFSESKCIVLHYCANCFQKEVGRSEKMRMYLHNLKNHNLKIRSSSSILSKPYNDEKGFKQLLTEINNFHTFIKEENVICTRVLI